MSCVVEVCEREGGYASSDWCSGHYNRQRNGVDMDSPIRSKAPNGSGWISENGYRKVWRDGKSVSVHRIVMEEALGRVLKPYETVHHRDGDKLNNDLDNLELWVERVQPAGQRDAHCMTCTCHEGGRT